MARLDSEYAQLKKDVENAEATPEEKTAATAKLEAREKHLAPAYQSVALEFADLHDRSGRMKAKANCTPCDWENARRSIYWSIRRKLNEVVSYPLLSLRVLLTFQRVMRKIATANPDLSYPERKAILDDFVTTESTADDELSAFYERSGDEIESLIQQVKDEYCSDSIISWSETNKEGVFAGVKRIYESLSPAEQSALLERLTSQQ